MGSSPVEVVVFGSINTDLVVYLPRLPHPGETVSGGSFATFPGGKGANSAVAASRSGASVRMHGAVGEDSFGAERIRSLNDEGVDTSGIVVKSRARSGVAQIWVDQRGENSIAVAPGANSLFRPSDVRGLEPASAGSVASFQNEVPQATSEELLRACKRLGYVTLWNVAPECRERPGDATLAAADYLILNENEIRAFLAFGGGESVAGESGLLEPSAAEKLALELAALGARNVVVTLGPAGSIWLPEGARSAYRQAAFVVEAVDSVGAGDCFCGVLAASLASGLAPETALERAAAAAAISVTRRGAQTSMPRSNEIDELVRTRGI